MSAEIVRNDTHRRPLELWGGIECTVARIGERFRDQCAETGHRDRPADLDAIAGLGIRTLRYPIIWETVSPERAGEADWSWHDSRLGRLRDLHIRPIAGLIHHGSGPRSTHLLDAEIPRLLAAHAGRVARRYPWIRDFTPVNEPLTTARFSALYGHWYPHRTDYGAFLRALVNQCRATVLAMRAIRRVTPDARLIQTEDFGKTFATSLLAYQAEHENERRWLSFDLLCGRVDPAHPWWRILRDHGVPERQLSSLRTGEGAPDVIGINHYLTSERFLDGRVDLYPPHLHGGNGRDAYADVEAVRIHLPERDLGPAARLREVWERYGRPIAVTEVHHGCTRDEQLRWLAEVWKAAGMLRAEGADIRAVTLWSLFGTVDWNTLLTRQHGIYEPGAFDIRGPVPRPTALARAGAALARTGSFDHPVLDRPGWWHRDARFYRPLPRSAPAPRPAGAPRPLLLTDATMPLGAAFARLCAVRGLDFAVPLADRPAVQLGAIETAIRNHRPWAVIDTIGAPAEASGTPITGAGNRNDRAASLADLCARFGVPLASFAVGTSAVAAEPDRIPGALILRTGPLFGPWDRDNPVWDILSGLSRGEPVPASFETVAPTYIPDLVHVALDLVIDGETGTRALASPGAMSGVEFALDLARRAGLDPRGIVRATNWTASGPPHQDKSQSLMPPLVSALDRFFAETEVDWTQAGPLRVAAE